MDATAIGLSALLVSTSKQMPICVAELHRAGLAYPVLIGGAAINRNFGRRAALVDGEVFYAPGVFYCKDAFEGLDTVDALVDPRASGPALVERIRARGVRVQDQGRRARGARRRRPRRGSSDFKVEVDRNVTIPRAAVLGRAGHGAGVDLDWDGMFAGMDLKTLYRLHWGARGSGPEVEKLIREDFEPRRLELQREAREQGWLEPRAVLRLLPLPERGAGPDRLRPGRLRRRLAHAARQARGDRALHLPAPEPSARACACPTTSSRRRAAGSTWWRSRS